MKTVSWLANVTSVHDLGLPTYLWSVNRPYDDDREEKVSNKWLKALRQPAPLPDHLKPYFNSAMHDSWVMDLERTDEFVLLRLDSIDADIFALELSSVLGHPPVPSQWPIEFRLHKPVYMRAARYDPTGQLRFASLRNIGSSTPQKGAQFLYERFFEEAGRLQWISEIWWPFRRGGKLSSSIFLMVDFRSVSVLDRRTFALERAYGVAGRILWEEVLRGADGVLPFGGVWGMGTMQEHLRARIAANGFREADFRPVPV